MANGQLCACGCGHPAEKNRRVKRGHLKRILPTHCACGCDQKLEHKSASSGYIARYVHGHNDAFVGMTTEEKWQILAPNIAQATARRLELHNDPEWAAKRNAAVADGKRRWWAKRTDEERREHGQQALKGQTDEGRKRLLDTLHRNHRDPELQARKAAALSKTWSSLTPEQRADWTANLSKGVADAWKAGKLDHTGTKSWHHRLPSGREILVQSTWEVDCTEAMETIGIQFERGGRVILGDRSWRPDFLVTINGTKFFLEVKGHPLAIKQFDNVQRPRLHHLDLAVALLYSRPPYPRESFPFLARLTWLKGQDPGVPLGPPADPLMLTGVG